jgi:hypothetical protein
VLKTLQKTPRASCRRLRRCLARRRQGLVLPSHSVTTSTVVCCGSCSHLRALEQRDLARRATSAHEDGARYLYPPFSPLYSSIPSAQSSLQTLPKPKMWWQEKLAAAAARDLLKVQSNREQRAAAAQSRKRLMLSSGSAVAAIRKVLAMPAMSGELWRRGCGSPSRELRVTGQLTSGRATPVLEQLISSRATPFPEQNEPRQIWWSFTNILRGRELLLQWPWRHGSIFVVAGQSSMCISVSDTQAYFLLPIHINLQVAWSCCCC